MADRYEPAGFEQKWRDRWEQADLFKTEELPGREKFYALDFFPYPSGAGLSVGHARNFVPTDVLARMKRMQGFNVLHPMGFDAFGLPAENAAIKEERHPAPMIDEFAARYQSQMTLMGIGYDWSRTFKSSDPSYYKWTQWIFELLYKRGLAYQKLAAVNWDPVDKTVLADEEVIGGRAERSGALVEKKYIPQWFFRITAYAQRLIDDLDTIDWPEGIKNQQRNWIGRSEGAQFTMVVAGTVNKGSYDLNADPETQRATTGKLTFDVFTTRIDTIFGMTFCVLAPEHPLVEKLPVTEDDRARIKAYQEQARTLSDADRQATTREKTGVFTGAYAINPANGKQVPIWLADYVLATYGTGAIMAVPAHDSRDMEFAVKFGIDVIPVIRPSEEFLGSEPDAFDRYNADPVGFKNGESFDSKDSVLINSGEYTGLTVKEAQNALGTWIEALGIGERKIQYKLRDWLISRQRYWGCPIPIIHTKDGDMELVHESALPVELPMVDNYAPSGDGTSPLAHIPQFVNCTDNEGRLGKRETDTMGGFACSSWYFLRFIDPHNEAAPFDKAKADEWMPVDAYVGGAEHAVMHLLYARFWTKVLFDEGLVKVNEPFKSLHNQGQVLGYTPYRKPREGEVLPVGEEGFLLSFAEAKSYPAEDMFWRWARMSKSKGNVVTPDEAVAEYGADALRLYLLFRAPFDADIEWENKGMGDLARFLSRVFRIVDSLKDKIDISWRDSIDFVEMDELSRKLRRATHQTIANVTGDIEDFGFNTYVSWLMKYQGVLSHYVSQINGYEEWLKTPPESRPPGDPRVPQHYYEWSRTQTGGLALSEAVETLILLLAPGAPHSADEMWEAIGNSGFTLNVAWPAFDAELATEDTLTIAVQVNGKLRGTFEIAADAPNDAYEEAAKNADKIASHLEGKTIRKVIVVPGKLVNLVVG